MNQIRTLGHLGEEAAASYLVSRGFQILDRNWRYGHLEIDLVCQQEDIIVFVEVKTRRDNIRGGPEAAITVQKMRNLSRAAQAWLKQHRAWERPCRFDVICLLGSISPFSLQHYPDAFPYVPTLDSRHPNWEC